MKKLNSEIKLQLELLKTPEEKRQEKAKIENFRKHLESQFKLYEKNRKT